MKWPFKREKREVDPSWSALVNGGAVSASGQHVDARSAESITAVFAAVQALSESVATLPLHVYLRKADGDRERADDHPLARVLEYPNPHQSGMAFRESMLAAVLLHGNAYARIETNGAGEVTALNPLDPRAVTVSQLPSGRYVYEHGGDRLLEHEVFHLADRTEPGSIVGRSRIAIARDQLGLSLALREHGASVFRNGAMPSGTLETENRLDDAQIKRLAESWNSTHGGAGNHGKTPVLESGLKYHPLSMSLEDAQWITAQQFSVVEIARLFRVPPTMLQDLSHASYSNTAELGSQFVRYSLQRWIAMFEWEISRQLLGPIARRRYYAEHSVDGLLRGNPDARASYYQTMIASGVMTANECRRLENLPPLENTDVDPA